MRPRLGSAIADLAADATADPSRWTHRVGVAGGVLDNITPTRNAIGLSRPTVCVVTVAGGRLIPWRSILPHSGGGSDQPFGRRHGAAKIGPERA